jgi:hypothetical protein
MASHDTPAVSASGDGAKDRPGTNTGGYTKEDTACVNAFKTGIEYLFQKDRNSVCAPETGQWFFHHPEYEAFRTAKEPRLLYVTAEAGGGKSTTMRTLVDTIQASPEPPLVAYFFFKDDDDMLRSYDDALSTILYQLLMQDRELVQYARPSYDEHKDAIRHQTGEMWDILLKITSHAKRDVLCVLDAVDECATPDRKRLIADLAEAFEKKLPPTSRLRLVASSRPYQDENHPYSDLIASEKVMHLAGESSRVQTDIRSVIRFRAKELAEKKQLNQSIQDALVEKLSEQNKKTRSFLAVRMAFEMLDSHRDVHDGVDEQAIDAILADIPRHLGDQFDLMLHQSPDQEHTRRIFCVILAARRTLKIPELKVIYSLTKPRENSEDLPRSYSEADLSIDDEEFKQLLRSRCGMFVTFVRNSVHLFHQTAREHLMAKAGLPGEAHYAEPARTEEQQPSAEKIASWKGSISVEDANFVCAKICLDILTSTASRDWVLEASVKKLAAGLDDTN